MPLVDYQVMHEAAWATSPAGKLYQYLWAGNGVYVEAEREHLAVRFPVIKGVTRGLAPLDECFNLQLLKVPVELVRQVWTISRAAAIGNLEKLFHLVWEGAWQLIVPEQEQTSSSCRPLRDGPESSHARAIIEIHSHHEMPAFWSAQDNRDETGFRLYGVLGTVLTAPELRLRVGVYGHFREIPPAWALNVPEGIKVKDADASVWAGGTISVHPQEMEVIEPDGKTTG